MLFLHRRVDSFVPGSPCTVCKKQVNLEQSEARTYRALMDDPLREVIPKFYREFEQNGEGELLLILPVFITSASTTRILMSSMVRPVNTQPVNITAQWREDGM